MIEFTVGLILYSSYALPRLWLRNCFTEMLRRTHPASPTLNISLSLLLSSSILFLHTQLSNYKHTHTDLFTHTCFNIHTSTHKPCALSHTYKHTHLHTETQTICSEACWSALVVPRCRMSCTLSVLFTLKPMQLYIVDLDPETLVLSVKPHWELVKVHVMKHLQYSTVTRESCKWENASGILSLHRFAKGNKNILLSLTFSGI